MMPADGPIKKASRHASRGARGVLWRSDRSRALQGLRDTLFGAWGEGDKEGISGGSDRVGRCHKEQMRQEEEM